MKTKIKKLEEVRWGFVGCGDVTEKKSGPAFSQIPDSSVIGVMRRNGSLAEDYARRHQIPKWTDQAEILFQDSDINAIYVATPPSTHAQYAFMAAEAGKHIYVEKPMAMTYKECRMMNKAAHQNHVHLFVAYYRRALPYFKKIKEILHQGTIGDVRMVHSRLFYPGPSIPIPDDQLPWRLRREVAGGGLFVDLGSHQLDLVDHLLGKVVLAKGIPANQAQKYPVEDVVSASFQLESGIIYQGSWCFSVSSHDERDEFEIIGTRGNIRFSTFTFQPIQVKSSDGESTYEFPRPAHIQKDLIQRVVNHLLGKDDCPSTGLTAARTTKVISHLLNPFYS